MTTTAGNNYAERLQTVKNAIEKAKTDRTKAETNKENLEKQRENVIQEIRDLGVDPDNLNSTITELDNQIQSDLTKLEQLIPDEYRV